jgi:hypothetical protein
MELGVSPAPEAKAGVLQKLPRIALDGNSGRLDTFDVPWLARSVLYG